MKPPSSPNIDLDRWLPIGHIVGPQGLKGEVRIYPDSDFPERFETPGKRWLCPPQQSQPEPIELIRGRYLPKKGLYVVKLAGVDNRDQAELLRQSTLLVQANDRPSLLDEEYYIPDLIGLKVVLQNTQREVGMVVSLVPAGNDLLEVQLNAPANVKVLIPFVKEIVPSIDLDKGILEISPPSGLLPSSVTELDSP